MPNPPVLPDILTDDPNDAPPPGSSEQRYTETMRMRLDEKIRERVERIKKERAQ